jgi:hypothetical protein
MTSGPVSSFDSVRSDLKFPPFSLFGSGQTTSSCDFPLYVNREQEQRLCAVFL